MTPYERGQRDMQRRAAEVCEQMAATFSVFKKYEGLSGAATACNEAILSLPIVGEATNPGEQVPDSARIGTDCNQPTTPARPGPSQECVSVPRDDLQSIIDSYEMGPEIYPTTEHCLEATIDKLRAMLAATGEIMNTATASTVTTTSPIPLNPGEIYVGLATDPEGKSVHHVVLLPGDVEKNWADAKAWAESIGGELPTRTEALLLFHTQRAEFQRSWYWTSQQPADDPSYAWCQTFTWGGQNDTGLSFECRARAVRRVPVGEE